MTFFWCCVWMTFLVVVAKAFYCLGNSNKEEAICKECYEAGYAKCSEEVNAHIDSYVKGTEWKV